MAQCHNPEDRDMNFHRHENLTSLKNQILHRPLLYALKPNLNLKWYIIDSGKYHQYYNYSSRGLLGSDAGVTTQKTSTWIFTAVKTSNFAISQCSCFQYWYCYGTRTSMHPCPVSWHKPLTSLRSWSWRKAHEAKGLKRTRGWVKWDGKSSRNVNIYSRFPGFYSTAP